MSKKNDGNPLIPQLNIPTEDGPILQLRVTLRALAGWERDTGRKLIGGQGLDGLTFEEIECFAFHATRKKHPNFTKEQIGDLLDLGLALEALMDAADAIQRSFPDIFRAAKGAGAPAPAPLPLEVLGVPLPPMAAGMNSGPSAGHASPSATMTNSGT